MKNPLTSKERRGLTAVAAAALLCIGMGFVARSCGSLSPKGAAAIVVDGSDSVSDISECSDSSEKSEHSESVNGKRNRREKRKKAEKKVSNSKNSKKKKAEKSYPVRDPLSQPCD